MSTSETFGLARKSREMTQKRRLRSRNPETEAPSLIRVKRCHECKTQYLLGEEPGSAYYKACQCGRSDIERALQNQRQQEWIPMTTFIQEQCQTLIEVQPAPDPPKRKQHKSYKVGRFKHAWHGFRGRFRVYRQEKAELLLQKANTAQRHFWNPVATSCQVPSRPRRFRRSASLKNWFYRFRSQLYAAASYRRSQFLVTPLPMQSSVRACPSSTHSQRSNPMTQRSLTSKFTFDYENPAFEKDLDAQENEDDKQKLGTLPHGAKKKHEQNILQDNFTIGTTSSLLVAMLSHASFAFFVLWFVLYCSTLHVILPEMKYLHKYVTMCSLVLLTSLNSFRFYLCLNADKNQNSYLFTGTKTLTVLVIGALASLLVTDAYAEPPRAFHIIISTIFMTLLIAEGFTLLVHHNFLRTIIRDTNIQTRKKNR